MTMAEGVYIIEDERGFRDALIFLLSVHGIESRGFDGVEAFLASEPEPLGCVLADVRMAGRSGIDLLKDLNARPTPCPTIIMTGHADVPLAVEAMRAGAIDFIEKPFTDDRILRAIRHAHGVSRERQLTGHARRETETALARLSARERDVFVGVVAGKLNKQIAHELEISPRTVEIYRANLMRKTNAHSVADLVRLSLAGLPLKRN